MKVTLRQLAEAIADGVDPAIVAESLGSLAPEALPSLAYDWERTARPDQLAPGGAWRWWLVMTGRGWGKTSTAAQWVHKRASTGIARRIGLVAQDPHAAREIMIEGSSGLCRTGRPDDRPTYSRSLKRLTWPNGAIASVYSAEDPDQLRGPEHDTLWADELASLKHLDEVYANADMGLRLNGGDGSPPRGVLTTTPRPLKLLRELVKDPGVAVTRGTTYDNAAHLPIETLTKLRARYEGTRRGRQELEGALLDDVVGALFSQEVIDRNRVKDWPELPALCVAVDPSATSNPDTSSEAGIVVVGASKGTDATRHGYVLEDLSAVLTPTGWARSAVDAYRRWEADCIVAEVNNGGEMVSTIIRGIDATIPVKVVRASRGKKVRAEPVAALYEQDRMHHLGTHTQLEEQMCAFTGGGGEDSPDRLDALVWGAAAVVLDDEGRREVGFA